MKAAVVALCIVACAYAASEEEAKVLRSAYDLSPQGGFHYNYETDNGIQTSVEGKFKSFGKDDVALEIIGSNSYKAPDGTVIETSYVADENGYRPQGEHLPTTPPPQPIPEYIQKAIEYIAALQRTESKDEH